MMERMEKMMIWMVAPPAYQYGPLIPYCNERGSIAYISTRVNVVGCNMFYVYIFGCIAS